MDFLKNLDDNSILIIPSNIKEKILDYMNESSMLKSIKLLTFNDIKKGLMYDYTNEAINYVMKNFNVNYNVAKNYINNTYYLTNEFYNNEKLELLLNIKNQLNFNNLLIKDNLFKSLIKNKSKIYVYGFDKINKFNTYLLEQLKRFNLVEIINKEQNEYKHPVLEFNSVDEEIIFVAEEIAKLITKGIPLNKIYIANYNSEYYFTIHKIFKMYGIPYFIRNENKLYDTSMGKYFINNLDNNLNKLMYKISKKYDIENNQYNNDVYNKLFNLVNTYYWCDNILDIKELIIAEANNISVPSKHYEEEIKTINLIDNVFDNDEYVFLIGFNLGSIPIIKKDEDFINDSIKTSTMETSKEFNSNNKEAVLLALKNIKNITITYKLNTPFNKYFPSFIIDNNYLIKEKGKITVSKFSNEINKTLYASKLDDLIKFNEYDKNLDILNSNYVIPYKEYDNSFTGIDNKGLIDKLKTKPLSYSTISNYFKCPFKFYLSYMYRLDKYEQTLDAFIGSLFHEVLDECINDNNKDIDQVYNDFIKKYEESRTFNNHDYYYIEKVRPEIHFIINAIKEQYNYSEHDIENEWHEKEITIEKKDLDINTNYDFILTGVIDKALFKDNDAIIIDYKTGLSDKIDRSLFEYGLNIQLPIYIYLLKNLNNNYNVVGMYLQHILMGLIKKDKYNENKTIEEIRIDRLKLDGITLNVLEKIKEFDNDFENNPHIQGLKQKTDGTFMYPTRIMSYEEQDELYNLIKKLLETAINEIGNSNFKINPIKIEKKANGCDYCKYKDICFVKPEDIKYIDIEGSDDNE